MRKIVLIFGVITGVVLFSVFLLGSTQLINGGPMGNLPAWTGFLIMLVVLSVIFVGIKRYRDTELGGVIRFGRAFLVGLYISLVAAGAYVFCWEVYQASTNYTFAEKYAAAAVENKRAEGVSAEELKTFEESMETMKELTSNPFIRVAWGFLELFPFALIISLISAGLLRKSNFLPASGGD